MTQKGLTTMLFWVVMPCVLVGRHQSFGNHTASIFRAEASEEQYVIFTVARTYNIKYNKDICLLCCRQGTDFH